MSHVTVVAGLLLTLDHYQPQISLKLHIKYCTLDDKIVACLSVSCNYYISYKHKHTYTTHNHIMYVATVTLYMWMYVGIYMYVCHVCTCTYTCVCTCICTYMCVCSSPAVVNLQTVALQLYKQDRYGNLIVSHVTRWTGPAACSGLKALF